jgi:hypothetical protein
MAIYDQPQLAPTGVPIDSFSTCQTVPVAAPWSIVRVVFNTTMLGGPPFFTVQPESQTVPQGATVTFTVEVGGFTPITMQWRKDGVNLAGQTSATLTLTSIATTAAGLYDVVASNAAGETTSDSATLTVEGQLTLPIYLGNAGPNAPTSYSQTEIKALQQTSPLLNPVLRSELNGVYEISAPASGVNEYRVIAVPGSFVVVDAEVEFRSGGAVLPMTLLQTDLTIDGENYWVYRTMNRSAGDFTTAGNTAIVVIIH